MKFYSEIICPGCKKSGMWSKNGRFFFCDPLYRCAIILDGIAGAPD
jgi:endogenous inhibitor of DNA gyrase (YacG/DUF329 family)